MAVDLNDLVEPLKAAANPPGSDLYPGATDEQWFARLQNGFWDARLKGLFTGYEEDTASRGGPAAYGEGMVTPLAVEDGYDDPDGWNADEDLSRELQQLIVLWSAWKIVLAKFQEISTVFRAKAPGPVEFEEQKSATLLKAVLDNLREEIQFILHNLSTYSPGSTVTVLDAVIERNYSQAIGEVWWVR